MIVLDRVSKSYPPHRRGGSPTPALGEVSLTIEDGQFLCIVGPSGCGKTTLLHLVAGFEPCTTGQILLDGVPVTRPGADRTVVFQQPGLYPWLSVRENIAFGLVLRDGRRRVDWQRVHAFVHLMGLDGFEDHPPYQLSGGMQQRVAIARAMITEPKILLMDEPFGALDAQTRNEMQRFLLGVWEDHRSTVLFITHDVEEAILLGDRVVVMTARPGRIAQDFAVPLARPRQWEMVLTPEFVDLKRQVLEVLRPQLAERADRVRPA
jgi:NitT/TauT family transport system ATP-binding protein